MSKGSKLQSSKEVLSTFEPFVTKKKVCNASAELNEPGVLEKRPKSRPLVTMRPHSLLKNSGPLRNLGCPALAAGKWMLTLLACFPKTDNSTSLPCHET